MKSFGILIIMLLPFFSNHCSFAQQRVLNAKNKVARLAADLDITPEKATRLSAVITSYTDSLKSVSNNPESDLKIRGSDIERLYANQRILIKGILNPEEYERWKIWGAKRKKARYEVN